MSITALIALVGVGIAIVVMLLHVLGRSRRMPMSPEDARAAWHRAFPDDEARQILVTPDGLAALILTRQGKGLVWPMSIDPAARQLLNYDVTEDATGLVIRLHDTPPATIRIHLPPEARAEWLENLGLQ